MHSGDLVVGSYYVVRTRHRMRRRAYVLGTGYKVKGKGQTKVISSGGVSDPTIFNKRRWLAYVGEPSLLKEEHGEDAVLCGLQLDKVWKLALVKAKHFIAEAEQWDRSYDDVFQHTLDREKKSLDDIRVRETILMDSLAKMARMSFMCWDGDSGLEVVGVYPDRGYSKVVAMDLDVFEHLVELAHHGYMGSGDVNLSGLGDKSCGRNGKDKD